MMKKSSSSNSKPGANSSRKFFRPREQIPSSFICPLTCEIMQEPVFDRCAHTFELQAIQDWIDGGHAYCPISRKELTMEDLTPNDALQESIARWKWRREDNKLREMGIDLPSYSSQDGLKVNTSVNDDDDDDDFDEVELGLRRKGSDRAPNAETKTNGQQPLQRLDEDEDAALPNDMMLLPQERQVLRHVRQQYEMEQLQIRKRWIVRVVAGMVIVNAMLVLALFLWVQFTLMSIEEQSKEELSGEIKIAEQSGRRR